MSEHRARILPKLLTPKARRYMYRVAIAGLALLVAYGVVSEDHALLWAGLLVPVLAIADDNVA